jgi:hypothetical protein
MGKQPRKRRAARLYDIMYGDGTRGSHANYNLYSSRTKEQIVADLNSYVSIGSASFFTASLCISGTNGNGARVDINGVESLYDNGTGSFSFCSWFKPSPFSTQATGSTLFAFAGSSSIKHHFEFGVDSGSADKFRMKVNVYDRSGSVAHSFTNTTLTGTVDSWNFAGISVTKSGANTEYTMVLNGSSSVNSYTAIDDHFARAMLGNLVSGAIGTDLVDGNTAALGYILQAAFWDSTKTVNQMLALRNSGVPKTWVAEAPKHYWIASDSATSLVDHGSSNYSGSVVSGTITADAP